MNKLKFANPLEAAIANKAPVPPPKKAVKKELEDDPFTKEVKKWLAACPARHTNLNAYFSGDSSGKRMAEWREAAACYASVSGVLHREHDAFGVYINRGAIGDYDNGKKWYGEGCTREQTIKWLNYLANDSVYAKCFIVKDGERMVDDQVAWFYTDLPANLVIGAATQVRQSWEYTSIVNTFDFFTEMLPEMNKDFVMYLGHLFKVYPKADKITYSPLSTNHTPLHANKMDKESVRNLINGYVVHERPPLNTKEGYKGFTTMFSEREIEVYSGSVRNKFGDTVRRAIQGKKVKADPVKRIFSVNERFYDNGHIPGEEEMDFKLVAAVKAVAALYDEQLAR